MPNTFELIASSTVGGGGAADITFSSIPSTYTDLKLLISARYDVSAFNGYYVAFNGSTLNFTGKYLLGNGASASSASLARYLGTVNGSGTTANTFNNAELYIPNYTSSAYKSYSADNVAETNATTAYVNLVAGLWSNTAAINSIAITPTSGNFVQYSTAYLYGIKKD
jgi:hypothetical protein